jgi:hypothetical protein
VNVADDVTFIATANIGNEYTATKVLDKANARRFPVKLEMSPLNGTQLKHLLGILYKNRSVDQINYMNHLISISDDLIAQCNMEDAKITSIIPPANIVEMADLVMDGFTIEEIAEAAIYPEYPDDGGASSERTFVKSILQKYFATNHSNPAHDPLNKKNF